MSMKKKGTYGLALAISSRSKVGFKDMVVIGQYTCNIELVRGEASIRVGRMLNTCRIQAKWTRLKGDNKSD